MRVITTKRDGESNERMITRFNKMVQSSRKVLKVRQERYWQKDETKIEVRRAAVKREHYRAARKRNNFY